ncbi:MAG: hypothetical protein AB7R77_18125 [Ilumatobacteraceae bacterium]
MVDDDWISDEELAALALAADPDVDVGDDAVPFDAGHALGLLPEWYMPPALASGGSNRRRVVVGVVIGSLVALNALGLCVTYGTVVVAGF